MYYSTSYAFRALAGITAVLGLISTALAFYDSDFFAYAQSLLLASIAFGIVGASRGRLCECNNCQAPKTRSTRKKK